MSTEASDPRVHELLLADPVRIGQLAGFLDQAAQQSAHTADGLRAAAQDAVWHGLAADTFRRAIGPLPVRLDGLHGGLRTTGAALSAYAAVLDHLQSTYRRASAELASASAQLTGARADAEAALAVLRRAIYSPASTAALLTQAQQEAERTAHRVGELGEVAFRLRRRLHECLDEFEAERAGCRARIGHARQLAPSPASATRLDGPLSSHLAPPA